MIYRTTLSQLPKFWLLLMVILITAPTTAQDVPPAPTLPVPTLMPYTDTAIAEAPLLTESALAHIVSDGAISVGVLYNEPPYSEFNISGELVGYEADLARAIAEAWQVEITFKQVTRFNAIQKLNNGEVDILIASVIHRRELDAMIEFSQTYRVGTQSMMVFAENNATVLANMANSRIGYVVGTESETAVAEWQAQSGIPIQAQSFLTLDQAHTALINQEIDGLVGRRSRLRNVSFAQPELVKILEEALQTEPYAIAFRRQDRHLRNSLNRTLQYLLAEGTLETLHNQYFPGEDIAYDALPLWANIGEDAPDPRFSPTSITYPTQYIVPRLQNDRTLRIAGLLEPPADASTGQQRVYEFQQALVQALASRWQVALQPISGDPLQLLTNGSADIAIGLPLDWQYIDRVDFSAPYLLHGDRLMVPVNSSVESFNDLRGSWVGVLNNEEGAASRVQEWADSINVRVNIYTTNEQDAAFTLLVENNADVIYADSLKLIAHLQENANLLRLTERWYTRDYMAFALPANDIDWRTVVDYTLQDMYLDGTLLMLLQPVIPPGSTPPAFDVWQGSNGSLSGF